jgi:hypothetical protein
MSRIHTQLNFACQGRAAADVMQSAIIEGDGAA